MSAVKRINLALQGGGAHGAFAWGVLEKLLEDERIEVESISGTSAGTMNAVCFAYGLTTGGRDQAKAVLENFWRRVSETGRLYSPTARLPGYQWPHKPDLFANLSFAAFDNWTRIFSPYQFNPFDFNPLRTILSETVDFDVLRSCDKTKLFISTTHVRTGKVRVFQTPEISLSVAMASACLPMLYQAVEVDDDYYWDGGYTGNPALFPFHYHTQSQDVLIVHINPIERDEVPTSAHDIMNRVNEITFNASLLQEMRAIAFVQKLLDQDLIKDEHRDRFKYLYVHSIRADEAMREFSVASKLDTDWNFLNYLRKKGRREMGQWLERHFDDLGQRATVDLHHEFLNLGPEWGHTAVGPHK
ncbi:MAG: patatin-like phospholipase family protein [Candidatus Sericytochromatia bacterium]